MLFRGNELVNCPVDDSSPSLLCSDCSATKVPTDCPGLFSCTITQEDAGIFVHLDPSCTDRSWLIYTDRPDCISVFANFFFGWSIDVFTYKPNLLEAVYLSSSTFLFSSVYWTLTPAPVAHSGSSRKVQWGCRLLGTDQMINRYRLSKNHRTINGTIATLAPHRCIPARLKHRWLWEF